MTKAAELPADIQWHFIGPLQSNKAAPLVKKVGLPKLKCIETVASMKLGAFDYLLKPVKLEELLVKVANAFDKKDSQEEKMRSAQIKKLLKYW